MAIQIRRGNEADFDASKMLPGEWAVSIDTRYVRMCFAPGIVLRMATYDSFEDDMSQIKSILAECKSIQSAVQRIQSEVNSKASLTIEYANSAQQSADRAYSEAERAKTYANNAEAVTGVQIATKGRAGLIKGGNNHIAEDGTLMLITETTETTMPNSHDGRLLVEKIGGVCEQKSTTGKNLLNVTLGYSTTKNGVTCTIDSEGVITLNGTASELSIFYAYEALTSKAGKSYKLEVMHISGSTSQKVSASNQDASNGWLGYNADITNSNVVHFCKYDMDLNMLDARGIYVQKGTVINNLKFKLMFIQTDVDGFDSVYEPYTGGLPAPSPSYPQEIKKSVVSGVKTHNKQLVDFRKGKTTSMSSVTYTVQPDGSYKRTGTATSDVGNIWIMGNYGFTPNEYNTLVHLEAGERYYIKDCALFSNTLGINTWNNIFTVDATKYPDGIDITGIRNATLEVGKTYNDTVYPLICRVSDGEEWEPYKESSITLSKPIDLYGIGDVQDVIKDGAIKRRFKKVVFNGSEYIEQNLVADANGHYFHMSVSGIKPNDYSWTLVNAYCTRLKQENPSHLWNTDCNGFAIDNTIDNDSQRIRMRLSTESGLNTVDSLKAKLAEWNAEGHPLTFVLELAEEVTEPLPLPDQIALNTLATFDGITYLEFDSEIEPTFEGEYGTSKVGGMTFESLLTARNNDLRLSSLEASVVNNI